MKFLKIVGIVFLILIVISSLSAVIESNYCHFFTTTPPAFSPPDYIKTGVACELNSSIAIPGIALLLAWKAIF